MSDIENKIIGIQGYPVSPTAPLNSDTLQWNGSSWGPAPLSQINGTGTNQFGFSGTVAVINATETIYAATSNVPVKTFSAELVVNDTNYHTVASYPITPGMQNWNVSFMGIDTIDNNNSYSANLLFNVVGPGSELLTHINPSPLCVSNEIAIGNATGWSAIATLMDNNVNVMLSSNTGTYWGINGSMQQLNAPMNGLPVTDNLILWLRPDLGISVSGSNVISWIDQSGNGNTVIQSNSDNQPTFNLSDSNYNNFPTLSFSGNQWLDGYGNTYSQPNTVIVVGNFSEIPSSFDLVMIGSLDGNRNDILGHSATQYLAYADGDGVFSNSINILSPNITVGIFNEASSQLFINDMTSPATGDIGSATWNASEIGATEGGSQAMYGTIAEIIAYNRVLSTDEINAVVSYLGTRYNITVTLA